MLKSVVVFESAGQVGFLMHSKAFPTCSCRQQSVGGVEISRQMDRWTAAMATRLGSVESSECLQLQLLLQPWTDVFSTGLVAFGLFVVQLPLVRWFVASCETDVTVTLLLSVKEGRFFPVCGLVQTLHQFKQSDSRQPFRQYSASVCVTLVCLLVCF